MAGMTKAEARSRKERQFAALIDAASRVVERDGIAGLRARDLAQEIGCALGAIYNLVADMDEIILRVSSRTLERLHATMRAADPGPAADAVDRMVALALVYTRFAHAHTAAWRALFEHRMRPGSSMPEFAVADQMRLFDHVLEPVRQLMTDADEADVSLAARTIFSAVHGIVVLDLDEKLIAVPRELQEQQIATAVRWIAAGMRRQKSS